MTVKIVRHKKDDTDQKSAPGDYEESIKRALHEAEKISARLRAGKNNAGFFGFKNKGGNKK